MIETGRLVLRPWRQADKPRFRAIINTPVVMEHFGGVQPDTQQDALVDAQIAIQAAHGFSMWAVEHGDDGVIGICGVRRADHYAGTPVAHELEIGWRLGRPWWGRGLAREAAAASIDWSWANTAHPRVVAWTNIGNRRSWTLMERLGMTRRPALDFRHPHFLGNDDPLGDMIVYAIDRP